MHRALSQLGMAREKAPRRRWHPTGARRRATGRVFWAEGSKSLWEALTGSLAELHTVWAGGPGPGQ